MNIAICDDDKHIGSKLELLANEVCSGTAAALQCEVFFSGDTLLTYLRNTTTCFQIYLLDIEMAGTDGLQVASRIREQDKAAVIIFITSHYELMQEAFEVEAFHFLLKPLDENKVKQVLLRAVEKLQMGNVTLEYTVRKQIHTLYFNQIECFESRKRIIVIYLYDGSNREYYGTLKEVVLKVPLHLFSQVHTSYVVNMDHIENVSGDGLRLRSGVCIPVSDKFRKSFQTAYRNYILMRRQ